MKRFSTLSRCLASPSQQVELRDEALDVGAEARVHVGRLHQRAPGCRASSTGCQSSTLRLLGSSSAAAAST
jgi:hypothetical protein